MSEVTPSIPLEDLLSLEGKIAIVTGAAQGFGRACASRLAEAGARVALVDLHEEAVRRVAAELGEQGRTVLAITADTTNERDVERAVAEAVEGLGGLHVLVNNAGVFSNRLVEALDPGEFRRVVAVNLEGTFMFAKAAEEAFRAQRSGLDYQYEFHRRFKTDGSRANPLRRLQARGMGSHQDPGTGTCPRGNSCKRCFSGSRPDRGS